MRSYTSLVTISAQVQSFVEMSDDNLIIIHSRDSAYSGSANKYRDTDFIHYKKLIDYLIRENYFVVRISRESVPFQYDHIRYLDLSMFDSTLYDQLFAQ